MSSFRARHGKVGVAAQVDFLQGRFKRAGKNFLTVRISDPNQVSAPGRQTFLVHFPKWVAENPDRTKGGLVSPAAIPSIL